MQQTCKRVYKFKSTSWWNLTEWWRRVTRHRRLSPAPGGLPRSLLIILFPSCKQYFEFQIQRGMLPVDELYVNGNLQCNKFSVHLLKLLFRLTHISVFCYNPRSLIVLAGSCVNTSKFLYSCHCWWSLDSFFIYFLFFHVIF